MWARSASVRARTHNNERPSVLGVQFDLTDGLWYPVGITPLVALHHALRHRTPASKQASS